MPGLLTNSFYLTLFFSIIIFLCIAKFVLSSNLFKVKSKLSGDQQLHVKETPRVGGLLFLFSFILTSIVLNSFDNFQFGLELYILTLLIFLLGFVEDIYQSIHANFRFIALLIVSIASAFFFNLPDTQIFLVDKLIDNEYLELIFFGLCIMLLLNGNNMIDGLNGLCILNNLCTILGIIILSLIVKDKSYFYLASSIFTLLLTLLFFNFPNAKLFLGDSGAYIIGFLVSFLLINFFYDYSEFDPLIVWILIGYPISEVIFSFFRKIINKKSPFYPDKYHTHIKLFHYNKKKYGPIRSNPISTITLSCLWLTPLIFFILGLLFEELIISLIVIYSILYLVINLIIPKPFFDYEKITKME